MSGNINGVMLNAYPDSIGEKLSDMVALLLKPEMKDVFSLFYVLPTFFNSDLDRGFSIIDYGINDDLVSQSDIDTLKNLGIRLKFDIVLNHLSVASPQFKDLLKNGDGSPYKDFFINWNEFWAGNSELSEDGIAIPHQTYLDKLFMRKSGLPILNVLFPDGTERPYWNTFYQKVSYKTLSCEELDEVANLNKTDQLSIVTRVNDALQNRQALSSIDFAEFQPLKEKILQLMERKRSYLGQMDVNARSPLVWEYYEEVLKRLSGYGCSILRLDAFAYLHKEVGQTNFFNKPGTWEYLSRINDIAIKNGLTLLPEIHAEYGVHLHDEVAQKGYIIYDFFVPGLILHTIEKKSSIALINWAKEVVDKGYKTVNMLGCHDGIPVLDLKGKEVDGSYHPGLLSDEEINDIMDIVLSRGGKVKNLYGADGKKISYYQINATYYSALGEDDRKILLARAIQIFLPGTPQIWYLDLFNGKNDYAAVEKAGPDGHKEINRSTLSMEAIEAGLKTENVQKQIELLRLRNTHPAFLGSVSFDGSTEKMISITWKNNDTSLCMQANLDNYEFSIR
jgi:sucrose phosphorylase